LDKKNTSVLFFGNWLKFFSAPVQKRNNFQFCEIYSYKKGKKTKKFPLLYLVVGYGKGKNQDLGSGKNTLNLKHCLELF
jgi:hypothetical protein